MRSLAVLLVLWPSLALAQEIAPVQPLSADMIEKLSNAGLGPNPDQYERTPGTVTPNATGLDGRPCPARGTRGQPPVCCPGWSLSGLICVPGNPQ